MAGSSENERTDRLRERFLRPGSGRLSGIRTIHRDPFASTGTIRNAPRWKPMAMQTPGGPDVEIADRGAEQKDEMGREDPPRPSHPAKYASSTFTASISESASVKR